MSGEKCNFAADLEKWQVKRTITTDTKKTMKPTNYVVILGWMITHLKLKGYPLLLYSVVYSFGQDTNNTGFVGMDCDLQSYCEGIIPRSSYYEARKKLHAMGLLTYNNNRFIVAVPDSQDWAMCDSPETGLKASENQTKNSPENGLTPNRNNKNIIEETGLKKSSFYEPEEQLRRLRERRTEQD